MRRLVTFSLLLLLAPGCASHAERVAPAIRASTGGRFEEAAEHARRVDPPARDRLLWQLERGKLLLDAGRLEEAEASFAEADHAIERHWLEPEISFSREAIAALTHPESRPWRARPHEAILLSLYRSLAAALEGDLERARVHLRRAATRRQEALGATRTLRERAAQRADQKGISLDELQQRASLGTRYPELAERVNPDYADLANPLISILAAAFAAAEGDRTEAESWRRDAAALLGAEAVTESLQRPLQEPAVLVWVESGRAPAIREDRLPLYTPVSGLSVVSLPRMHFFPLLVQDVAIRAHDTLTPLPMVVSIESIFATAFRQRLPLLLLRGALAHATKETLTQFARHQDEHWGLLLGSLYKGATAGSDTRAWQTPGARVYAGVFPRPADSRLELIVTGAAGTRRAHPVELPAQHFTLVYVRTHGPGATRIEVGAGPSPEP